MPINKELQFFNNFILFSIGIVGEEFDSKTNTLIGMNNNFIILLT